MSELPCSASIADRAWQKLDAGADLIALLRSRQGEGPKSDRDAPAILSEVMAAFAADPTKVPQQLAKWNVMDKKFLLTELLPLACKPLADQHSAEARLRRKDNLFITGWGLRVRHGLIF